jgi:hypothetical protein
LSRCRGCNDILTDSEMLKINKHTGRNDELCKHCRSPDWDNGYILDPQNYGEVVGFINEVYLEHNYVGGGDMSSDGGILECIENNGYIGIST